MLLILAFSLVIASVFLIIYRKNKDSILWLGLCTSLMLELCGVMLFIAKKGGISQEVLTFLYFSIISFIITEVIPQITSPSYL
jgi:hypothetical protein